MRRLTLIVIAAALAGVVAQSALAGGGRYSFDGGTAFERTQVHAALDASTFDWGLIPAPVAVHIGVYGTSYSTYGNVFLDASLLDSGLFSWGVVQHEFGHQVDFFLLDDAKRAVLQGVLGGKDWCYETAEALHSDHGCERFASGLAWAYWPVAENSMRPDAANAFEGGAIPVDQFRALLSRLIGAPSTAAPGTTKAFAPASAKPAKRAKHTRKR